MIKLIKDYNFNEPCIFLKYRVFILLIILSLSSNYYSTAQNSDLEYGLLNVGSGALIGGIGAVINKDSDERIGKVFLKGLAQGALGGYLVFESKRLLRTLPKNDTYAFVYPSKFLNAAGNSIIENAASNDNFWVRWHINFGFNRIDIYTENKFELNYKIMPFSLYIALYNFGSDREFSVHKSLKLGTMVFEGDLSGALGRATSNIIVLKPYGKKRTEAHELVHTYQYEQFSGFNSFFNPFKKSLREKSGAFRWLERIFYVDFNYPLHVLITEGFYQDNSNIFEKEAYFLINNRIIQ